jgi:hypothetical protein
LRPACGGAPCIFAARPRPGVAYLQIVESRREGDQVRQQVIATLGRFEDLRASGQLERLLRSGARFAAKAMMLSAAADDAATKIAVHRMRGIWDADERCTAGWPTDRVRSARTGTFSA